MTIPQWLDDFIFKELGAQYRPQYSDMTNIDDDRGKTLNYLGTYFPRSYVESYCIFSEYFKNNKTIFSDREELSIFDFGSGTGGEIIGLLTVLDEQFTNLKRVRIVALDGNHHALRLFEKIMAKFQSHIKMYIEQKTTAVTIDDFYDLSILETVIEEQFDIIITFKAICEFDKKQQFNLHNPYEHIAKFLLPRTKEGGVLLIEDITTKSVTKEWLPKLMDNGLKQANCLVVGCNDGYNQTYYVTHSHQRNDKSNVAWRMIKR